MVLVVILDDTKDGLTIDNGILDNFLGVTYVEGFEPLGITTVAALPILLL